MKKYLKLLIIVILICVIGILIYKFIVNKQNKTISQDFSNLKNYIYDIYGKTFLIPEFDDINNADEEWLWENINQYVWHHNDEYKEKNEEEYGYTYEEISKIAKIIYGDNLKKSFPKGAVSMRYNTYRDLYGPTSFETPSYNDYKIDSIKQNGTIYTVSIYDYTISNYNSDDQISLNNNNNNLNYYIFNTYDYNLNGYGATPIITLESLEEKNILAKKDFLSHKILTIEYNEAEKLYHITSCKYEDIKPNEILATMYSKMKSTFEIMSIDYNYDDIYTQDEVIVENFDELSEIYTENSIDTYKKEMALLVFKDNGEVYITAGDITIEDYLLKAEFKNIEASEDKISCTVVRTFRESWDSTDELYNKTYEKEDKFTIIKIDDKWYVDEFNFNNI